LRSQLKFHSPQKLHKQPSVHQLSCYPSLTLYRRFHAAHYDYVLLESSPLLHVYLALGQLKLNQLLRHAADWQQTAARITHTTYRYNQHQQCWEEEIAQFEHTTAAEWAKSLRLGGESKWWHWLPINVQVTELNI
jgi:hypothetical protein